MNGATRPQRALKGTRRVPIIFEGREIHATEGETLVSALFGAGIQEFQRNPKSGTARGPFCLMGVCQDCRLLVNDIVVLGCLTLVRQGLVIKRISEHRSECAQ